MADSDRRPQFANQGFNTLKISGSPNDLHPPSPFVFLTPSIFLLDYTYECCWLITPPPFVITESLPESDDSVPNCIVRERFKAEILPIRRKTPNNQSINQPYSSPANLFANTELPAINVDRYVKFFAHSGAVFMLGFSIISHCIYNGIAVTWMKYCRYGVQSYPINQPINICNGKRSTMFSL